MSNDNVRFRVEVKDLVVDVYELAELVRFLRDKKFMFKDYVGKGKGFSNSEYDYSLVGYDEKSRFEIMPISEAKWLYLNTFGKEKE